MPKNKRANGDRKSDCLGQIAKRYSMHCSDECPKAGTCVIIVMGYYPSEVVTGSPPEESRDSQS